MTGFASKKTAAAAKLNNDKGVDMEFNIDYDGYEDEMELNYKEIAAHPDLIPTIRLFAIDLQRQPYISPGDWFQSLSDKSLDELLDLVDEESEESLSQQLLLTQMLARAEGVITNDMEQIRRQLGMFQMLVAGTGLGRKQMVKVYYENMSFGEDMIDKTILEAL
jgi:hypothetical protein